MDNDNKPSKTIKFEVPSTPHHNHHAKSVAPQGLTEYDYFIPVLAFDVWPTILSHVTEKRDLESAMNTCQLFHDILQPRAFNELILPLLLLKKTISPQSALACRGINQNAKSTVENVIFNVGPPLLRPDLFLFEHLENFITKKLPNLPLDLNPFIWKRAEFQASQLPELQNILTLTENFGTNLTQLNLSVFTSPAVNEHVELLQQLSQALSNTPHIRILSVRVNLIGFALLNANEGNQVSAFTFPMLDSLSNLTLGYNAIFEMMEVPFAHQFTPVVSQFIQSFIESYGPQLDTFSCNNAVLNIGLPADLFSSNLANIKEFQMITTPSESTLDIMAQFEFPRLERLALKDSPLNTIPFSSTLLNMLENFGGTLTELYCGGFDEIEYDEDEDDDEEESGDEVFANWNPMSKLTKLTVFWKSFDSLFWPGRACTVAYLAVS